MLKDDRDDRQLNNNPLSPKYKIRLLVNATIVKIVLWANNSTFYLEKIFYLAILIKKVINFFVGLNGNSSNIKSEFLKELKKITYLLF